MDGDEKQISVKPDQRIADCAVVILCLAGAVFSLNLFRLDLYQTLRFTNREPAGMIIIKRNTVQRRLVDRVLWDRLREESPVYPGDTIRTAELSEAQVILAGGGEIALDQNTLIHLAVTDGRTRLDVNSGGMSVNAGSQGLVINAGGSTLEAAPGAVLSAAVEEGGGTVLEILEGNAVFSDGTGTREAGPGRFAMDGAGRQQERPALVVVSPRPNARFLNPREGNFPLAFSWNGVNLPAGETLALEIAEDRNFSRIRASRESAGNGAQAELPPGSWYWRITGRSAGPLAQGRFTVLQTSVPSLIIPADNSAFRYRSRSPVVRFQWTASEGALSYLFEAANNPRFDNPALSSRVQRPFFAHSNFGPGQWYWRVTPVFGEGYEGSSAGTPGSANAGTPGVSQTFSFRMEQSGALAAPRLVKPAEAEMVSVAQNKSVYFSWRNEEEAASYTIRISQNQSLQNPVLVQTVKENYFVYGGTGSAGALKNGQYYWGVSQKDGEGSESPVSPPASFTVLEGELVLRPVFPPDNYVIAENFMPDLRFTWKSTVPFERRLQISAVQDFSRLAVDERVSAEAARAKSLPPGTWYWRITAKAEGGAAMASPARRFTVAPPLAAPVLAEPGSRLLIREGEEVRFRWQPVPGAAYYQLRLYTAANRSAPVYERNLIEAAALPVAMNSFGEGYYYWTVQAFAPEGPLSTRRSGFLGEASFEARQIKPIILDEPAADAEIPGLAALRNPLVLRWSSREPVQRSRFILSRTASLANPLQATENPAAAITLRRLPEGDYYWMVEGETDGGFDISAIAPRHFRVLPIPLLSEAGGRSPAAGYRIGPDSLRQERVLNFRWNPVAGANAYVFSILQETPSGRKKVFSGDPIQETSFVLKDLSMLDNGSFVWQVEAVNRTEDGFVEQRGRPAENVFVIDIPPPKPLQPGDTGTLYGR